VTFRAGKLPGPLRIGLGIGLAASLLVSLGPFFPTVSAYTASRAHGAERRKGPLEAIYQGCLVRFRPIMMTTVAALLKSLPIALGYGAGGEARQPLGRAVCGRLLFSQFVTLYLMPVVYTYMAALSQGGGNERRKLEVVESPVVTAW
jgi:AcrB/AcrD/AcrF family